MNVSEVHDLKGPIYAVKILAPTEKRTLFLSFGAMAEKVPFAFVNILKDHLNIHKIFIRDTTNYYYQTGLPPITSDIPESIDYLKRLIAEIRRKLIWKEAFDKMRSRCSDEYLDLRPILNRIKYKTKINVYYDDTFPHDVFHVENIQSCKGIVLNKYPFGKHSLVQKLKESGELSQIIEKSISI